MLIILGLITLFTYLISSKIMLLLTHPKNVDLNVEYKHELQFPAVTICNNNMLRYKKILRHHVI